jgi:hypothetical protein
MSDNAGVRASPPTYNSCLTEQLAIPPSNQKTIAKWLVITTSLRNDLLTESINPDKPLGPSFPRRRESSKKNSPRVRVLLGLQPLTNHGLPLAGERTKSWY